MAKYIQFPAKFYDGNIFNQIYNTDTITLVTNPDSGNLYIYCGLIRYNYKVTNHGAVKWVDAINKAILAVPGPTLTNIVVPEDSFLSDFGVANINAV